MPIINVTLIEDVFTPDQHPASHNQILPTTGTRTAQGRGLPGACRDNPSPGVTREIELV